MTNDPKKSTYADAGVGAVSPEDGALKEMCAQLRTTFGSDVLLDFGQFANVVKVSDTMAIAIATDGVGTKILVAELMEKYDTIGIDCIAMNANDIVCVGARPISLVDYVAVEKVTTELLSGLATGLTEGAKRAGISIPGGEIAQVREMIRGAREGSGFDLVGTCIGTVHPDRIIVGDDVRDGDVVVGLRSSGIHSNGMTLARKALFGTGGYTVNHHADELGRTIGEELLEPTHIYVKAVVEMIESPINTKALVHITGDGFLNLLRVGASGRVGFVIDNLPAPHPIFSLIQSAGDVSLEEMFLVYNMGIGFCIVVPEADAAATIDIATTHGFDASVIGRADKAVAGEVHVTSHNLVGTKKAGRFAAAGA